MDEDTDALKDDVTAKVAERFVNFVFNSVVAPRSIGLQEAKGAEVPTALKNP